MENLVGESQWKDPDDDGYPGGKGPEKTRSSGGCCWRLQEWRPTVGEAKNHLVFMWPQE